MQILRGTTPPGFTSSVARSWDQINSGSGNPAIVKYINPTTAGVYDWSRFDLFFTNNAGKKIIFTLGQPADWMILRAAIGGANYGGKANMCPTGATELNNYTTAVTDIVSRAKNTHGVTGIIWELWNEIEGPGMYNDVQSSLGPMTRVVSAAIKAVDATAIVVSPSSRDIFPSYFIKNFLLFADGVGGEAGDHIDAICTHFYNEDLDDTPYVYAEMVRVHRQLLIDTGFPNLPFYISESGSLTPKLGMEKFLQRRMLVFAALGVKSFVAYAYDFPNNPLASYVIGWNETLARIQNNVIHWCVKNKDGTVTANINGQLYTV